MQPFSQMPASVQEECRVYVGCEQDVHMFLCVLTFYNLQHIETFQGLHAMHLSSLVPTSLCGLQSVCLHHCVDYKVCA